MMTQHAAASGAVERKALHLRTAHGGRPRLLLAEDSDPVRIVTAAMLNAMGCDVEAVVHGEYAVKSASETRFDVIVLDIEMPVMDGITAAKSIRQLGGVASGTPLMALSAFLADSVRAGHWRDTFDIALPKPANRNELHGAMTAALNWQPAGIGCEAALPPVIDEDAFAKLRLGISSAVWQQLTKVACRDIEVCADQLQHLAQSGDDNRALAYAGKLGGLGRTFAAPRLAAIAERVQAATSQAARHAALRLLVETARSTVRQLHG